MVPTLVAAALRSKREACRGDLRFVRARGRPSPRPRPASASRGAQRSGRAIARLRPRRAPRGV